MFLQKLEYMKNNESSHYPYDLSFLRNINNIKFDNNINYIIGNNGTGKSTLIETIALLYGIHPEGGSRNNIYQPVETESKLSQYVRLIRYPRKPKDMYFYRAESFYNLSANLDEIGVSTELFEKKLHHFSRGESFRTLLQNRFFGDGLYLLDEPESGLSLEYLLEFLVCIDELSKKGSQFIIATHSPILIMQPGVNIFQISETTGIEKVKYDHTTMYQTWKMLFDREQNFIKNLLEEDNDYE